MPNIITEPLLTLNAAAVNYYQSPDQSNRLYRAVTLYINISVGGTLLPVILGKDPVTGLYFPLAAGTALSVGAYMMQLGPTLPWTTIAIGGGSIAAGTEFIYPGMLPAIWAVGATTASAAVTATISASVSD
jgi:hypothetical protein